MSATAQADTQAIDEPQPSPIAENEDALRRVLTKAERPAPPSAASASLTFGWRALLKIKHVPEQLFDVTGFPIIMTLLFTGLFGGALAGGTKEFIQYFLPGVLVMSILMITIYTGMAISADKEKGVFDRFRTLPIWRPSPMVGYLLGDAFRYTVASIVILVVGFALGYRPGGGVTGVIAGVALVVFFSFAASWGWTALGFVMRGEKALQGASMGLLFPLTFLSNVFVDPKTMPGWLEAFTKINPVTHLVTATRNLMGGVSASGEVVLVLAISAGLIIVFGGLTTRLYNR